MSFEWYSVQPFSPHISLIFHSQGKNLQKPATYQVLIYWFVASRGCVSHFLNKYVAKSVP